MSAKYRALGETAKALGEGKRDCAVIAVTILTNEPYERVRDLFTMHGRKPGSGTRPSITTAVLRYLGYELHRIEIRAKTVAALDRENLSAGRYLFRTAGHVLARTDGIVHDFTAGRRHRIKEAYLVYKVG